MPRTTLSSPSHPKGRRRLYQVLAAFVVLAGLAGYLAVQYLSGSKDLLTGCEVRSGGAGADDGGTTYELGVDQAANAATIAAVGAAHRMPERAVAIALATAIQESRLRNIDYGDRDSLGLFQQRPSQGWGTREQIQDPVYASGKFYEHLAKISGYEDLPLTEAAQRVQRSGFPEAYAQHESDALLLASALTGGIPASLNCAAPVTATAAAPGDPDRLRTELVRDFGTGVLPAPEAAGPGATRTVVVPVRASDGADADDAESAKNAKDSTDSTDSTDAASDGAGATASGAGGDTTTAVTATGRRGWSLAHWAVARAADLGIDEIGYAGKVWTAGAGWRTEKAAPARSGSAEASESAESDAGEVRMRLAQ
ncbi:hypothetical protein [Streptomyces sp. NBC_00102]|uniref:hypothetical protein n=1 Tax=Streptomyces sp. NBC_00102 TaxID=2975652 RepID=UPI002256B6D5|nr:hypothetical protein [Streptomyces sp. NBC_00102]MCX5399545.1 hypothetical protein [Streptomyces sp. NBC_00102]